MRAYHCFAGLSEEIFNFFLPLIDFEISLNFNYPRSKSFLFKQRMKLGTTVALLACLVVLASCQDFTGGRLDELYTGRITISPTAGELLESYSQVLEYNPFSTTSQDFFIATALMDFSTQALGDTAGARYIHFEVVNERLEGEAFKFNVNYDSSVINTNPLMSNFIQANLNYIIIGSLFQGDSDVTTGPSSLIFARNGDLQAKNTANTLYDFKNTALSLSGPFNYAAASNVNCGAVKDTTTQQWRVESTNCGNIRAIAFMTGFEQPAPATATDHMTLVNFFPTTDLTIDISSDATIDADTTADGVTLADATANSVSHIQYSIIIVAIKDYPGIDNYFLSQLNKETFIVSWEPRIQSVAFTGTITQPTLNAAAQADQPLIPSYREESNVGHRFCGINDIKIVSSGAAFNADHFVQFEFKYEDFDLAAATPTWNIDVGTDADNQITIGATGSFYENAGDLTYSCVMLNKRVSCDEESSIVQPQSAADSYTITGTSTVNTQQFVASLAPFANLYATTSTDEHYIDFGLNLVNVKLVVSEPGTFTGSVSYSNVQAKGYEGIFHLSIGDNAPELQANGSSFDNRLTIEAFGVQIYRSTFSIPTASEKIHFSFFLPTEPTGKIGMLKFIYETDYTGTASDIAIEFGIIKHENLLKEDGTCTTQCMAETGFTAGINYRTIPPTCIQCEISFNLAFAPENGTCACTDSFVQISGFCSDCQIDLCSYCNTQKDQCFLCVENADYINPAQTNLGCACDAGYYKDDLVCKTCPVGCVTCTTAMTCNECVANDNTRLEPTAACACKPGYFENGNDVCGQCAPECELCSGTSTNCVQCNEADNFMTSGTTCVCKDGFALVIDPVTNVGRCDPCDSKCATCKTFKPNECILCAQFREGANCDCKANYIEYNGNCVDSICTDIPDCQVCQIFLATGEPICQGCASDLRVLSSDNKTCECKVGYFEEGGVCVPCGDGCAKCTSTSDCTECAISARNVTDGTCICPPRQYVTQFLNNLICESCVPSCTSCSGSSDNCQTCAAGFQLQVNTCVCPAGTYLAASRASCIACSLGCALCESAACDVCKEGYIFSDNKCLLDCPLGTFNAGAECKQCSDNCRSCTSSLSCRSCLPSFFLFAGSCRPSCPAGTYALSNVCIACSSPCATCAQGTGACTTCIDGFGILSGQCYENCPDGFYYKDGNCLACDSNCFNCLNSASNCVSCPVGQFLVNTKCMATCPYVLDSNGKCSDNCPSGQFLSGRNCIPCQGLCKTCTAVNFCSSCLNNLLSYNGQCVNVCPARTLTIDTHCTDCDKSCNGCTRSPVECVSCANGYHWLRERCVLNCPEGTYLDFANNACKQCDSGCKQCTSPGNCLVCSDSSIAPVNGQCANECGANCAACKNNVCERCSDGFISVGSACVQFCPAGSSPQNGICVCNNGFLYNNACVATCPQATLASDKECIACSAPCATCSESIFSCTSCQDGFTLEVVTKRCVKSEPCPKGRIRSVYGECRHICAVGTYYDNLACHIGGCPVGYLIDEANRACIKQTIDTGCSIPNFLQGNRCVLSCDPGFYPEPTKRVCRPCSSNCFTCLSDVFCVGCASGYKSENGLCVETTACIGGLVKHEGNCVSACPSGYVNRNGFCIRICPASTYFYNGGCYENCPTKLRTKSACVLFCPAGTIKNGDICDHTTASCQAGQYYNAVVGACDACRFPCTACEGNAITCTKCDDNYVKSGNSCVRKTVCQPGKYQQGTSCVQCPVKCGTCEAALCTTCAVGYTNAGNDCVRNTNVLTPVQFQVVDSSKRGMTVFYKVFANAIPNNLPSSLSSKFFIIATPQNIGNPVSTSWISEGHIFVAVTFTGSIPSTSGFLLLNTETFGSIYQNMGFSTAEAFVPVNISPSLPDAPNSLVIPPTASVTQSAQEDDPRVLNSIKLSKRMAKAIAF